MATLLILLLLILPVININSDNAPHCVQSGKLPNDELQALQDLYYSTNGPFWYIKWDIHDKHTSPCTWHGVCCSSEYDPHLSNVVRLELEKNNLHGTLLSTLANIQHLNTILFQHNTLYGKIPKRFGEFKDLVNINLADNHMDGSLYAIKCENAPFQHCISEVVLSRNNFAGNNSIELMTHCTGLTVLYLSNNLFNGTIPANITSLKSLQYLDLSGNDFSGVVPLNLRNLTSLKLLSLSNMTLKANISQLLPPLIHLNYLEIFNAPNICGNINDFICNATNITLFQVSQTSVSGFIPSCLATLKKLQVLDLSQNNKISGTLPKISADCNLHVLNIGRNNLHGNISNSYCNRRLQVFVIDHNSFTSIPDCFYSAKDGALPLPALSSLRYLDISHNNIKSAEQSDILNLTMKNLTYAFLHKNNFEKALPLIAKPATHLSAITIHDNNFNDNNLSQWLSALFDPNISPNLSVLSIYRNLNLHGTVPVIPTNSNLEGFFAHQCALTGRLETSYEAPQKLVNLTLFDNSLSCNIPNNYLNATRFLNQTVIVVAGNRFSANDMTFSAFSDAHNSYLPAWIDSSERSSTSLYITAYDNFQEYTVLIFTGLALFMLGAGHVYNCIHCKQGNCLLPSQSNISTVPQFKHPFFHKLVAVTNILGSKTAILFTIFLCIIYGTSSGLYLCGNELAHWSISYFQLTVTNVAFVLIMAALYNIGIVYLFYYLYFKFHQINVQFHLNSKKQKKNMDTPEHVFKSKTKSNKNKNKADMDMTKNTATNLDNIQNTINITSPNDVHMNNSMGAPTLSPPSVAPKLSPTLSPTLTLSTTMRSYDLMTISRDLDALYGSWKYIPFAGNTTIDDLVNNMNDNDQIRIRDNSILTLDSDSSSFMFTFPLWTQQLFSIVYALIFILLWFFTLFSVFLYFLFVALPNNNNLNINSALLPMSHYLMGAILSFNNIFTIPRVADCLILGYRQIYLFAITHRNKQKRKGSDKSDISNTNSDKIYNLFQNDYKMRAILIIILRSITNIVFPICCCVLLLNECGAYWILFWESCYKTPSLPTDNPLFNVDVNTIYYTSINNLIPYSINRPIEILHDSDICNVGFEDNSTCNWQYCMRDFFEYWGTTLLLHFVWNLFMSFLVICRYWLVFERFNCKRGFWFFASRHFRPDSAYAAIISYLEIIIIFGFVIPILIPLSALVFVMNFFMYKKMVQYGRVMPERRTYFPLCFLIFPIIISQIELILFFFVLHNEYGYINFVVLLFVSFIVDLIAFLKWYWKINDSMSHSKYGSSLLSQQKQIVNFLYAQTALIQNENAVNINNKMHIPSLNNTYRENNEFQNSNNGKGRKRRGSVDDIDGGIDDNNDDIKSDKLSSQQLLFSRKSAGDFAHFDFGSFQSLASEQFIDDNFLNSDEDFN